MWDLSFRRSNPHSLHWKAVLITGLPGKSRFYSYELSKYHFEPKKTSMLIHQRQHFPRVWRNFFALRCVNIFHCFWEPGKAFSFVFCIPSVLSISIIITCHCQFLTVRLYVSKHVDGSVILCPKCQMVTRYRKGSSLSILESHLLWNCQQLLFQNMGQCSVCSWNQHLIPRGFKIRSFSSILFFNVRAFASIAIEKKKKRGGRRNLFELFT